jgi:hypothetical protein
VGRKKRLPADAKPVTISLGGRERLILGLIEVRRQRRGDIGDSPNEIVADAICHYLKDVEKMSPDQIDALLPPILVEPSNIRVISKKDKK